MDDVAPSLAQGRYRLRSVLGQGGMATVYRAWDDRLEVERAIKVLHPRLTDDPRARSRFEDEARTLARLQHENLVTVHDVGSDDDRVYMVMEWLQRGSLDVEVTQNGPLSLTDAVRVVDEMLAGLGHAHQHGVVHRDIKPQNVLLTKDGGARVADFGIARAEHSGGDRTRTGAVLGTWAYMAPEQRHSATHADARADLYAVAATFYSVLTGRQPADLHASEGHDQHLGDLAPEVRAFIARGTSYRPNDRYPNAEAMRAGLRELAAQVGALAPLPAPAHAEPPPDSRTYGLTTLDGAGPPSGAISTLLEEPPADGTSTPLYAVPVMALVAVLAVAAVSGWWMLATPTTPSTAWHQQLRIDATGIRPLGVSPPPAELGQRLWRVEQDDESTTFMHVNGADYPWAFDGFGDPVAPGYRVHREDDAHQTIEILNPAGVATHRMALETNGENIEVRHQSPEGGTSTSEHTLDLRYWGFPQGQAPAIERYTVGPDGRVREGRWFDATGKPTTGPDRAWGAQYAWDDLGRPAKRTAVDERGQPMLAAGGVVSAVWTYEAGEPSTTTVHFEAFAGVPARNETGVHAIRVTRDGLGRVVRVDYLDVDRTPVGHRDELCASYATRWEGQRRIRQCFGPDGTPAAAKAGWIQYEKRFDERHLPVEILRMDAGGAPLAHGGWARRMQKYDDVGRIVVSGPHFRADGTLTHVPDNAPHISRSEVSYDAQGNRVELRYFDAAGHLALDTDGVAIIRMVYDAGRLVQWRAYDAQSMPVTSGFGYATERRRWDDRGYLVEQTLLDVHDRPTLGVLGWSRMVSAYDESGRPILEELYDTDGTPIIGTEGFARRDWSYDGPTVRVRLYGTDGQLTVGRDGWAILESVHDARGLLAESHFFGSDEAPLGQEYGETGSIWTYDQAGREIGKRLLGAPDALQTPCVRWVYDYDPRANLTRMGCRDASGQPTPFSDDVAYSDLYGEYDREDRLTKSWYASPDGEPASDSDGCWMILTDHSGEEPVVSCMPKPG